MPRSACAPEGATMRLLYEVPEVPCDSLDTANNSWLITQTSCKLVVDQAVNISVGDTITQAAGASGTVALANNGTEIRLKNVSGTFQNSEIFGPGSSVPAGTDVTSMTLLPLREDIQVNYQVTSSQSNTLAIDDVITQQSTGATAKVAVASTGTTITLKDIEGFWRASVPFTAGTFDDTGTRHYQIIDPGTTDFTTIGYSGSSVTPATVVAGKKYKVASMGGSDTSRWTSVGVPVISRGLTIANMIIGQKYNITSVGSTTLSEWQAVGLATSITMGNFKPSNYYIITSLGTTTQEQWGILGGNPGGGFSVGTKFAATGTGAGYGTGICDEFPSASSPVGGSTFVATATSGAGNGVIGHWGEVGDIFTATAPVSVDVGSGSALKMAEAGDKFTATGVGAGTGTAYLEVVKSGAGIGYLTAVNLGDWLTGVPWLNPANARQLIVDLPLAGEQSTRTEGDQTFDLYMSVLDGCFSETWNCTIKDRWLTTPTTSCAADVASVSEGGEVTFTCTQSNVNTGDTQAYTITGVSSADINGAPLTGVFTYGTDQCTGTLSQTQTFTISTDVVHPETETMRLTLDGTGHYCETTIVSVAPPVTYNFSCSSSVTEGGTITWNWSVTNGTIADGTVLNYTITGSAVTDGTITATSGSFTVNSNAGSFTTATIQNVIVDGTRQAIATITNGSPYDQVATCNVYDDDPACVTHWVSVPISWTPCYNGTDDQLESLTARDYGVFQAGSTQIPTAITVAKSSASAITVTASTGIDVTAGQLGTKVQLITGDSSSNNFNTVAAGGPVTGTSPVEAFMRY